MKGIKLSVIGVCISMLGIAYSTNNFFAFCGAAIGLLVAVVGYFTKDI